MSTSEQYLALTPWRALIQIINDRYLLDLNPETATLVEMEPLTATSTEVTIANHRSDSLRNLLPPYSQQTFVYDRLDIGAYLGPTRDLWDVVLPTTTLELVQRLSLETGIAFHMNDVIHEEVPLTDSGMYTLKAHPRSLRWVGSIPLQVITGA